MAGPNATRSAVRFRLTLAGSSKLGLAPLGQRTEATLAAPWPAPSFTGRLPLSQTVDKDGFRARWSASDLGRPYSQLWDSASAAQRAVGRRRVLEFGLRRHPADAGRRLSRDRSGDQVRHHVHRPHLRSLPAVRDGDRDAAACRAVRPDRPGALRSSICCSCRSPSRSVSALAYRRERRGRRRPGHAYNWALQRRAGPALAFGAILAGLFGGLYGLLQLEDVALLDRLPAAVRRALGGDVAHPQHPSATAAS